MYTRRARHRGNSSGNYDFLCTAELMRLLCLLLRVTIEISINKRLRAPCAYFLSETFSGPSRARSIVHERLHELQERHEGRRTIANGENAAGGFGITPQIAEELFELGIDVITTGTIWDKREIIEYMNSANGNETSLAVPLRPANYPAGSPGFGWIRDDRSSVDYAVINLQGRVFMTSNDDPFAWLTSC